MLCKAVLAMLCAQYCLQADMKAQPRMAEDGRLWTPGSVDFFRTINEQVHIVTAVRMAGEHHCC